MSDRCRDCLKAARFSDWAGYTNGCPTCHTRAFRVDPRHEYERRKQAWLADNPGAWAMEVRDACARFAEELGI